MFILRRVYKYIHLYIFSVFFFFFCQIYTRKSDDKEITCSRYRGPLFGSLDKSYVLMEKSEGWTAIGIRCRRLWNYVKLFWNSLDNPPWSIAFYLEMKVEVEVVVHDIRSRFTPRKNPYKEYKNQIYIYIYIY